MGIALRDPGLEVVPSPYYFNLSELNRYLKEVYAEQMEELRLGGPDSLLRMLQFKETEFPGRELHVPVVLESKRSSALWSTAWEDDE